MAKPFVSILIDTYNHERFIEQAIVSALQQDFPAADREIIVVDDGSIDGTPDVVRKFEPHVRLIRKTNGGQASAFNAGIPECKGEIIAFLDGDDFWKANKLQLVVWELEKNPELGTVGHGYFEASPDGRPLGVVVPDRNTLIQLRDLPTARLFTQLRAFLGTSRMTIRKKLLDQILPFPEELVIEADEYMFTLAPALAPALVLDKPLFYYRLHEGNLYQFSETDDKRTRRKQRVLDVLQQCLPPRLQALGIPANIIATVMQPLWIDGSRLRLVLDGGMPWETFNVERAAYLLAYKDRPVGYRLFKAFVLGATLVLPPRSFYKAQRWYASNELQRIRNAIGKPTAAAPIIEHRTKDK
ncbi:MAG TPA: glycosyltransferase [Candidatus Dormibacteraeota bacterium]|nr:glycosyltransferase [Candidatus Dormibacteraeota bacterium]